MPKSQQSWVPDSNSVASFIVSDFGDKVDSGIGLSYRSAKLHRLAGRYDNPMPESTISTISGTMNLASAFSDIVESEGRSEEQYCAGILEQPMGSRNRVGIELSYRPARLHRLAKSIPWNRFLGSLKV